MYYFIGIKGSGMASLASILKDCGEDVSGSDIEKYIFTQAKLEEHKIPFFTFSEDNIKDNMTVIIGSSFNDDHIEVKAAKANPTVKTYMYAEFLAKLVEQYHSICVSGTHGKTTTTGMLAHVFSHINPTGYLIGDGTGVMPKEAQTFVLEACEYQRRFLAYHPDYAIILNIELDHVDY
ncbi:Mur ligase domain-containing protein, partial [Breznakia sp. OttesenSCG-928-G09]|nr:Mur ligase domain-containing protein [Breznakia sp. OttesenSCG-928-G09]